MLPLSVFRSWRLVPALCFFGGMLSCSNAHDSADAPLVSAAAPGSELFSQLPASVTGVRFENTLTETQELNVFTYRNYYNGGGVAIADLNGDGVPEIILASNSGGPRVYLNKGNFHFRDITDAAGVKTRKGSWSTGVAIADVNGDGRLDVYICHAGPGTPAQRANELWINQGLNADSIPTFKEMASDYGVTDGGYSTQAVFVDYDRDGDLDLFLIRNSPRDVSSFGLRNMRNVADANGAPLPNANKIVSYVKSHPELFDRFPSFENWKTDRSDAR